MHEIEMRVGEALGRLQVVNTLLDLTVSVPRKEDGGAAAKAGMKLRGMRRMLSQAQEDASEQVGRGASEAATLAAKITLSFTELLNREDWEAIGLTAERVLTVLDKDDQPVARVVTTRKTEALLDALGPLFDEPDGETTP